jgi:V-type H+-transporting ATPase subunit C
MVVPRSSSEITSDDEFTLFAVTTFKKHSAEFVHKCREKRWIPRDYRGETGGNAAAEEKKELENLQKDERKLWGEALRLGRNGYSEAVMTWMHAMALKVFVETVLRYGLPAEFICGIIRVCRSDFFLLCHELTFASDHTKPCQAGSRRARS